MSIQLETTTHAKPAVSRSSGKAKAFGKLHCLGCNKTIDAACDCGVGYVPPGELALNALIADRDAGQRRSNVLIAEQLGIDEGTVRNAHKKLKETGSEDSEPEKRTGRDGKTQAATKRKIGGSKTKPQPKLTELVLATRTCYGQLQEAVKDRELQPADKKQVKALAEDLIVVGHKLLSQVGHA